MLGHFSNLKNLIKIPPLCNCAAQAAEIFVERRYRTSHHNILVGTRNAEKNFLLGTPKRERGRRKDEKKEKEGGRKKKGRGKGGRKKEGGKISFFTGALYTFYVHSTILKISTPAAGRHLGFRFFSRFARKKPTWGVGFFFPCMLHVAEGSITKRKQRRSP